MNLLFLGIGWGFLAGVIAGWLLYYRGHLIELDKAHAHLQEAADLLRQVEQSLQETVNGRAGS